MIALSVALVVVAALAFLSARDWIALQRQKHEDSRCRVLSAEDAEEMRAEIAALRPLVNGLAMQRGLTGR